MADNNLNSIGQMNALYRYVSIGSAYTIKENQSFTYFRVTSSTVITLPTAPLGGFNIIIKNDNPVVATSAVGITVNSPTSAIEGKSSVVLAPGDYIQLIYDGTAFYNIVNKYFEPRSYYIEQRGGNSLPNGGTNNSVSTNTSNPLGWGNASTMIITPTIPCIMSFNYYGYLGANGAQIDCASAGGSIGFAAAEGGVTTRQNGGSLISFSQEYTFNGSNSLYFGFFNFGGATSVSSSKLTAKLVARTDI